MWPLENLKLPNDLYSISVGPYQSKATWTPQTEWVTCSQGLGHSAASLAHWTDDKTEEFGMEKGRWCSGMLLSHFGHVRLCAIL